MNEHRLVVKAGQRQAFWQHVIQVVDTCQHGLGGGNRIGIAFLVHRNLDGFTAANPNDGFALLMSRDDLGHILDVDGAPVDAGQDGSADVLQRTELIERTDQVGGAAIFDAAAGQIDVLGVQPLGDLRRGHAQLRDLVDVEQNLDFVFETAGDLDCSHTDHRFQRSLHLVFRGAAQPLELFCGRCAVTRQ